MLCEVGSYLRPDATCVVMFQILTESVPQFSSIHFNTKYSNLEMMGGHVFQILTETVPQFSSIHFNTKYSTLEMMGSHVFQILTETVPQFSSIQSGLSNLEMIEGDANIVVTTSFVRLHFVIYYFLSVY